MSEEDTRTKLLKTALHLFAKSGFDGVSIRDLTAAADVNLGAIGYHFGSKDGLIHAVLELAAPVNAVRLAALDACERDAEGPLAVDHIVRALVEPAVRFVTDPASDGFLFHRIYNIASVLRPPLISDLVHSRYDEVAIRFIDALARVLPHIPRDIIVWRYVCALGSMLSIIDDSSQMKRVGGLTDGREDSGDSERVIEELVSFLVGGITAPYSPNQSRKPATRKGRRPSRKTVPS